MRVSAIDESILKSSAGAMPMRLEQKSKIGRAIATTLIALPIAGLAASLVSVAAAAVLTDPAPLSLLIDKPAAALGLLSGIAVTAALIAHPVISALSRIGRHQTVEISTHSVSTTEVSPFGTATWVEPLANYAGLAHHIRTSLSGVRHEIVLVHREPARSVLLAETPRLLQSELDSMAKALRLPIVPASMIYAKPTQPRAPVAADYQAVAA